MHVFHELHVGPSFCTRGSCKKKKYQPVRGAPAAGPMGRAVLVTGTPGVGKTTFAEELAALSGWKHVEVPLQIASPFFFARFGSIFRSSSKNGEILPNC